MLDHPIQFKEADEMISSRTDHATALKYKTIMATWSQDARQRAFFSARVADATVLSELHRTVQRVISGEMTQKQAVRILRERFAGPDADALSALGFAPKRDANGISELASIPRLNLIVSTNVRMAQECGHYKQWEQVKDMYPFGIWHCGFAEEHRPEHLGRDGKLYPFEHPIWRESPPGGEFNCHCWRENTTKAAAEAKGMVPEDISSEFAPSSLGFDPSRPLDGDTVQPGKRVLPSLADKAKDTPIPDDVLPDMKADEEASPEIPAQKNTPAPADIRPETAVAENGEITLPEDTERFGTSVTRTEDDHLRRIREEIEAKRLAEEEAKRLAEEKAENVASTNTIVEKKNGHLLNRGEDDKYLSAISTLKENGRLGEAIEKLSRSDDLDVSQSMPSIPANKRDEVLEALAGKNLKNRASGIAAQINRTQRSKMKSPVAFNKSILNGFSSHDHNLALANIVALYENSVLLKEGGDTKNGHDNIIIRRFAAPFLTDNGVVADVLLTLKESTDKKNSVRIYSLELTEIKMPSEKTAANDKSNDYGTDGIHNLALKRQKVKDAIKKIVESMFIS